jgi:hypothetical protein
VWRDWYRMLAVSALTLVVLFGVGAYTFMVTVQRIHSDEDVNDTYQPPTSREEMLETAVFLDQRTTTFEQLRATPPVIPDPGTADTSEPEEPIEETVDEEVNTEQVEE